MNHYNYGVLVITCFHNGTNTYKPLLQDQSKGLYQVVTAESSHSSVTLCRSQRIDTILLDASAIEDSTVEVLEQLQMQMGEECPPIIVVDRDDVKLAVQAMKVGAADYLIRDEVTGTTLTQAIKNAIGHAQEMSRPAEMLQGPGKGTMMNNEGREAAVSLDSKRKPALELADTQHLQQISTQLIEEDNITTLYEQILDTAIALMGSDMATLQWFDPKQNALRLLTHRGLHSASVNFWQWVQLDADCCCNITFKAGQRVIIPNIDTCAEILEAEDYPFFRLSNIKAVQSTPLMSRQGQLMGIIATYWQKPHHPSQQKLHLLDVIARQMTDLLEQQQTQAHLQEDLAKTQLLRNLSVKLIGEGDSQILYEHIVTAAVKLMKADAGALQILDPRRQKLIVLASQGLDTSLTEHFYEIDVSSHTSCGLALAKKKRIFLDFNVSDGNDPTGSMRMHRNAGYHSAQSTPLINRFGQMIGRVSTYWRDPHHRPTKRELYFLDLLARQAADLIEQRQLLEREQAARAEAERNNRIKDEFLSILSHELRTPLSPILVWSQLLQTQKFDAKRTAKALAAIEHSAIIQAQLIDDLLDSALILRGKLMLNLTSVDLASVINAAIETVTTAAMGKSIAIDSELSSLPKISGDPVRLQQIIWNLLSNAIKFTPEGGTVKISLTELDNQAQITVRDTGRGISPEFLPYVFESFRQQDSSLTRQFGGLGLGLSIVRYLVEAHSGTITAESPGKGLGATFTVRLPLVSVELQNPPTEPFPNSEPDLRGIRVLAVDDETETRELLTVILTAYKAEVKTTASAVEALTMLESFQPDVLVSDLAMVELDGYDLMQRIRALPAAAGGQISAIALTAYAQVEDQQRAIASGYQTHLAKPIDIKQLVGTIANLAGHSRETQGLTSHSNH